MLRKIPTKFLKIKTPIQQRFFSKTSFIYKKKAEDDDDDEYEYEYEEYEEGTEEKEVDVPIDDMEGEWSMFEMSERAIMEKTRKVVADVKKEFPNFGQEGYVMDFPVLKDEPDIVIRPKSAYPDWVHEDLLKKIPTEDDLLEIQKTRILNDVEKRRLIKLVRKRKIKELNGRYSEGDF